MTRLRKVMLEELQRRNFARSRDTVMRAPRGERVHPKMCIRLAEVVQELARERLRPNVE